MLVYVAAGLLFMIGVYCVAVKKNLIKIIMGIIIMEYAANLLLVSLGYYGQGVDPLTQAMVLCVILLGLATTIILIALALRIYERYGTFDITKVRQLRG